MEEEKLRFEKEKAEKAATKLNEENRKKREEEEAKIKKQAMVFNKLNKINF